jgi:dienelactone hydrolase
MSSEESMTKLFCLLFSFAFALSGASAQENPFQEMRRLYDYDPGLPLAIKDTLLQNKNGIEVHDLTYASPKTGRVTAYLIVPPGKGPFAGIVFGHWGYGTRTEFLPEAMLYAEAGAVCILPDYPWVRPAPWRRSTRDLSDPELDRDIYIQAVVDLRRGIDLLLSRPDVDAKRIAYIGHSYGAQWGAVLSAVDKRIKAAVLIGGVAALEDIFLKSDDPDYVAFRERTPKEQIDKYLEVNRPLDAINYVPYAAPTPLLFQFARYERYFNEASMQRYAQAASEPKLVKWYDTGHELNDFQALLDRAKWLEKQIGIKPLAPILRIKLEVENYSFKQPMAKPDFSGTWQFNRRKSSLQIPPPDSTIFIIEQHEPRFHLSRTHVFAGKSDTFSIELTTDGKTTVREHGNMKIYVRLYWDEESLVFDSEIEREGKKATNIVRYKLADKGQTFIADERFHGEQQSYENTWVFDKQ